MEAVRAYNDRNRELINAKARARYKTPERRAYSREYERQKRATNPAYLLTCRMRHRIKQSLRTRKIGQSWRGLVDFTIDELVAHLEARFQPGMSWDNIGQWHIDHIRPLASFHYDSPDHPDFKVAWALSNLQPLWARDNLSKGAKLAA